MARKREPIAWGTVRNKRGLVRPSIIRRLVREIAERFQPEQIILFGSYAYGEPHRDSDVDVLVVMPARNEIDQSVRILHALDPPFPVDIIVRKPKNLRWRLEAGDWFLREVVGRGKLLHEQVDQGVGGQGGSGSRGRQADP